MLIFPGLGPVCSTLSPWVVLVLRIFAGAPLVAYALRSSFGFFPNTGVPVSSIEATASYMRRAGWHPAWFWAWASTLNNLIAGVLIPLGLLTRPAALTSSVLLFLSAGHHLRRDGYFANQNGLEHYALWGLVCLYFVVHGGGVLSLDHMLGWEF